MRISFDKRLTGSVLALAAAIAAPASAKLSPMEALGKSLFLDKTLSHNATQSCASCHDPDTAFTDPDKDQPTSAGDNPALFGSRNAPSAMYLAFSPTFYFDETEGLYIGGQFDDGRAATLEQQAMEPFLGHVEMGNDSPAAVIAKLQAGANANAFSALFGATAFDDVDTAFANLATAIATYERSSELSPFSSKFDAVLRGKTKLTLEEARGLDAFNDPMKGNCAACHISSVAEDGTHPLFTDFSYDNIGIPKNYASGFLTNPLQFNPDGVDFADAGLGAVVGDPDLFGAFKVTTLRNIDLTGPYGHNGYFSDLDSVIDFYATRDVKPICADPTTSSAAAVLLGCWPAAEFAATMNVDELGNLPLSAGDKADIKAFLATLSDGYIVAPEPGAWVLMLMGFALTGSAVRSRRRREARSAATS